jgi:hypothetical protein
VTNVNEKKIAVKDREPKKNWKKENTMFAFGSRKRKRNDLPRLPVFQMAW